MDRNFVGCIDRAVDIVALRKESVDRNIEPLIFSVQPRKSLSARRAWIEIPAGCWRDARRALSLSARRAWIEIKINICYGDLEMSLSARRAWIEIIEDLLPSTTRRSLSARRAWIEIRNNKFVQLSADVALRKESVDRNIPSH